MANDGCLARARAALRPPTSTPNAEVSDDCWSLLATVRLSAERVRRYAAAAVVVPPVMCLRGAAGGCCRCVVVDNDGGNGYASAPDPTPNASGEVGFDLVKREAWRGERGRGERRGEWVRGGADGGGESVVDGEATGAARGKGAGGDVEAVASAIPLGVCGGVEAVASAIRLGVWGGVTAAVIPLLPIALALLLASLSPLVVSAVVVLDDECARLSTDDERLAGVPVSRSSPCCNSGDPCGRSFEFSLETEPKSPPVPPSPSLTLLHRPPPPLPILVTLETLGEA